MYRVEEIKKIGVNANKKLPIGLLEEE